MNTRHLIFVAPMLWCAAGCANKQVDPWTPKPLVHWADVATRPIQPVRDGFQIQAPLPDRGTFPLSLGVTRVTLVEGDTEQAVPPLRKILAADPRNEFLQWNRALDDLMAVSDVFPVSQRDMGGGQTGPQRTLAAFRALHARLGLVYGVNELNRHHVEMLGVLYDTKSGRPLATLHTQADSQPPLLEADDKDEVDLWKYDARARVREKFAQMVHACVRELILQDQHAMTKKPAGPISDRPARLVDWPAGQRRPGP